MDSTACPECKKCNWKGIPNDRYDWDNQRILLPLDEFLIRGINDDGDWVFWAYKVLTGQPVPNIEKVNLPIELNAAIATIRIVADTVVSKLEFLCGLNIPVVGGFIDDAICTPLRAVLDVAQVVDLISQIIQFGASADPQLTGLA
ncbi:MAG: hypothetical protein ACRC78_18495, partial [Planktothrix sp.]